jgi:hypothetical protein
MAVFVVLEMEITMTQAQSDAVFREVGGESGSIDGLLFHVEGPVGEGPLRVVDVWESEEQMNRFFRDKLMPAFQRAGVQPPADMRPQLLPARNLYGLRR